MLSYCHPSIYIDHTAECCALVTMHVTCYTTHYIPLLATPLVMTLCHDTNARTPLVTAYMHTVVFMYFRDSLHHWTSQTSAVGLHCVLTRHPIKLLGYQNDCTLLAANYAMAVSSASPISNWLYWVKHYT